MDLAYLSGSEQAALVLRREVSPVELVEVYLQRIQDLDGGLNCYIAVFANEARAAARTLEDELLSGGYRGPLHGIPFAIKDVIQVGGRTSTCGIRRPNWSAAREDATAVRRLREAGAILLGTLNTHELQLGGTLDFPYGMPRNPYDSSRSTGGSSSGSASAVAAGLCSFSLGGDTGGSVRAPAAYCGVVGLKPTWSRISRHGVMGSVWTLDTLGILARSVQDAARVLSAIAGHDPLDPTSSRRVAPMCPRDGARSGCDRVWRIGLVREHFDPRTVAPEVLTAAEAAVAELEAAGAEIREVSIGGLQQVHAVHHGIVDAEAAASNLELLADGGSSLDRNTRMRLLAGAALPGQVRGIADRARVALAREVLTAFEWVDFLVGPTTPTTAPSLEDALAPRGLTNPAAVFTRPYSFAGVPAVSVPVGCSEAGLPVGLQFAAASFAELELLEASDRVSTFSRPVSGARSDDP